MASTYRYDDNGLIYRVGNSLSHVGAHLPERDGDFSFLFAFFGLISGGALGIMACFIVSIVFAIFSSTPTIEYNMLDVIIRQVFTIEFVFTTPAIITACVLAVAAFFWDRFRAFDDVFLVSFATLGFLLSAILGLIISILVLAIVSAIGEPAELTSARIVIGITAGAAVLGFLWNGFTSLRDGFSLHLAFLGFICGILKGVVVCVRTFLASGCTIMIIALIVSPLVIGVAFLVVTYNAFKGFFLIGSGGQWSRLWNSWPSYLDSDD